MNTDLTIPTSGGPDLKLTLTQEQGSGQIFNVRWKLNMAWMEGLESYHLHFTWKLFQITHIYSFLVPSLDCNMKTPQPKPDPVNKNSYFNEPIVTADNSIWY